MHNGFYLECLFIHLAPEKLMLLKCSQIHIKNLRQNKQINKILSKGENWVWYLHIH
jgi:hypothetical protein